MDEARSRFWRRFWRTIPLVLLVLWFVSIGLIAWMGTGGMLLTDAQKQADCAMARLNLAKEEELLVQFHRGHKAIVTKVYGEVLDEILATKDEVSEAETRRRVDAAVNKSTEVAALRQLIFDQADKIAQARQRLAETESRLPK